MESSPPLSHFLRDLLRSSAEKLREASAESIHKDTNEPDSNIVEIVFDNPRSTCRNRFSFCKTDSKGSLRWGEESNASPIVHRNSPSQLNLHKKSATTIGSTTTSNQKVKGEAKASAYSVVEESSSSSSYSPMMMDRKTTKNCCNCKSEHCPYCRKESTEFTQVASLYQSFPEPEDLPSLVSMEMVVVNSPGERWEEPTEQDITQTVTFKSVPEDFEELAWMDDLREESTSSIPGMRYSSSSLSSGLSSSMSSLPDIPQRKPSSANSPIPAASATRTTRNMEDLHNHLQFWRNTTLSEEESGASGDSSEIPGLEFSDVLNAGNSASSLALPTLPQRRSSIYHLEEFHSALQLEEDDE